MCSSYKVECLNCKKEYEIKYIDALDNHLTYVVCPLCNKEIYAASDFGYGPVWPGYVYYGEDLLLTINFDKNNNYEIKTKFNANVNIKIPRRNIKGNYKHHFKIVRYVYKKYQKLKEDININIKWFNDFFIENIKGLSYDADRQINITKGLEGIQVFDLEDIADELDFKSIKPLLEKLAENMMISNEIIDIVKKIDDIFNNLSYGSNAYDPIFWTYDGVKNHHMWVELRKLACDIIDLIGDSKLQLL